MGQRSTKGKTKKSQETKIKIQIPQDINISLGFSLTSHKSLSLSLSHLLVHAFLILFYLLLIYSYCSPIISFPTLPLSSHFILNGHSYKTFLSRKNSKRPTENLIKALISSISCDKSFSLIPSSTKVHAHINLHIYV